MLGEVDLSSIVADMESAGAELHEAGGDDMDDDEGDGGDHGMMVESYGEGEFEDVMVSLRASAGAGVEALVAFASVA